MMQEFNECYPLHLGVTEAGDGEDGRIKSALGIGSLLEDGIGDTIRVSLTEDPEFEIPVCQDLVIRYQGRESKKTAGISKNIKLPYSPFQYKRRSTVQVENIGSTHVPVVVADFMEAKDIRHEDLSAIGYVYQAETDKWNISDSAADFIYTKNKIPSFELPGTLRLILDHKTWMDLTEDNRCFPLMSVAEYISGVKRSSRMNFIVASDEECDEKFLQALRDDHSAILCLYSVQENTMQSIRSVVTKMMEQRLEVPVILAVESHHSTVDEQLIHFSAIAGGLFLDGIGDGIWLMNDPSKMKNDKVSGRTYLQSKNNHQFLNNTSFSILQAVRTRISKTEYISCPSCGRTLFDLQETTAKIRKVTHHLKGLKIAVMGCIVNGPGEMADADFGYVGSGVGKITLYRGKEVVKRNINSDIAVEELIQLLKDSDAWTEPQPVSVFSAPTV